MVASPPHGQRALALVPGRSPKSAAPIRGSRPGALSATETELVSQGPSLSSAALQVFTKGGRGYSKPNAVRLRAALSFVLWSLRRQTFYAFYHRLSVRPHELELMAGHSPELIGSSEADHRHLLESEE